MVGDGKDWLCGSVLVTQSWKISPNCPSLNLLCYSLAWKVRTPTTSQNPSAGTSINSKFWFSSYKCNETYTKFLPIFGLTLFMLNGGVLSIVRKENLHEAVLMIKVINSRGNLTIFSCSLITGTGILYLPISLSLFCRAEKGCKEVLQNRQTSSSKKGSAELLVVLLFKCAMHAFCTTHFLTTLITRVENLTSNFLWGHKNAGWKPLSCVVFKEQSSIELKLYPILQYLADRWHKPNLLLKEARWLASRWACMGKDI